MFSLKSTVCFCPSPAATELFCCGFKAVRLGSHGVDAGLQLWETEPSGVVRFHRSLQAVLHAGDRHVGARDGRARWIGDRTDDGAGGLALCQ